MRSPYLQSVFNTIDKRSHEQPEFHQSVIELLGSLENVVDQHPEWEHYGVLERFVEPDRSVVFRVPWVDDKGKVQVNRGYRVQFNNAIGPYKGGLRFHPSVNLSIMKCLAFEMVLKNGLTTLPLGGGKGGSNFDPKGKSEDEIMRFCHSFAIELQRHIGGHIDIPAGDIGVSSREIGFIYGMFKRLTREFDAAALTGKHLSYGGSLVRTEATGYGICYFTEEVLREMKKTSFDGKNVVISGSGNVAIYTALKAQELGAKILAMSDSNGFVYDPNGINMEVIRDLKERSRRRIKEYADLVPGSTFTEGFRDIWSIPCDIAIPCATQNEIDVPQAQKIIEGGCIALSQGANMPCTLAASHLLQDAGVVVSPDKAANAGGVSTSALEMTQNSMRLSWTFEEVDQRLHGIMKNIFKEVYDASEIAKQPGNLITGANLASFLKISDAMIHQGIV
ncbi:MAG: NADP-specific glutamate dehydrogenase [Oscillospiraceae bacterium]|nr:NADP-specific glutamate dehydrogenase [Oscillospiraceae bacterium]